MNLRRFWISAGAITTFVVGVSFVAYATGKFTSEASSIEGFPLEDFTSNDIALPSDDSPIPDEVDFTNVQPSDTTMPDYTWSETADGPAPEPTDISVEVENLRAANEALAAAQASGDQAAIAQAQEQLSAANSALDNTYTRSSTGSSTKGKALNPITPPPAVQLQSFLQTNFASVDSILRIGIPRLLISFAGLIALIFFLINAVKFLFGAGNEKSTTEGKQGMAFAGIGLAIVIAAYLLVTIGANVFK